MRGPHAQRLARRSAAGRFRAIHGSRARMLHDGLTPVGLAAGQLCVSSVASRHQR